MDSLDVYLRGVWPSPVEPNRCIDGAMQRDSRPGVHETKALPVLPPWVLPETSVPDCENAVISRSWGEEPYTPPYRLWSGPQVLGTRKRNRSGFPAVRNRFPAMTTAEKKRIHMEESELVLLSALQPPELSECVLHEQDEFEMHDE